MYERNTLENYMLAVSTLGFTVEKNIPTIPTRARMFPSSTVLSSVFTGRTTVKGGETKKRGKTLQKGGKR